MSHPAPGSSRHNLGVSMKLGVPWRVKGIRPDARETAREAARRAGMSVGEWLNAAILDSAVEEGVRPRGRAYADADDADDDNLFGVHERLDELTRQLERLNRGATAPSQGAHGGFADTDPESLAAAIARLDRRLDQLITEGRVVPGNGGRRAGPAGDPWTGGMDQAIAEITARQQALDADPSAPRPTSAPARMPSQNLSGLEQQLRHITTQIEALRAPSGLEEGIAALRGALGEIARTLTEAMPRRAIEALESEVRALAGRLDSSRNSGVDAPTLAAVERGLAEIRDALRTLTPAENLSGFREAVVNLAQKIDILGSSTPDPSAFHQLESAISALRGIVSHVASNEALAQLTAEVRNLAAKIDQVAGSSGGDALAVLEKRIAHIAEALDARAQSGGSVPPQLDALIKGLSDKIERIQLSRGDQVALSHFEDRIVKLAEKLDASGARFSQLESIERGLADLLVHMEAPRTDGAATGAAEAPANVDGLQRDLVRTQTSLEAVHGTLGHVVDRLAMLETDMRGPTRAEPKLPPAAPLPAPRPAAGGPQPQPAPPDRATAAAQAAAAMARANPKAHRPPIDPSLPPDHPLEPGSGPGRGRLPASAVDRIAASEAALGPAKPPVIPDPGGKSNFIAAARRAAQAAAAGPSPADLRAAAAHQDAPGETPGKTLAERVRSLFVGASVILLIGGSLRIAANLSEPVDFTGSAPPKSHTQADLSSRDSQTTASAEAAKTAADAGLDPEITTAGRPSEVTGSLQMPAPPSLLLPPIMTLPPLPGSRPPPNGDKLPAAIGGAALHAAAAAGNSVAEYEVGMRYAEGRGVAANPAEAARWLERAAKQSLALAQFRLASLYEKGIGVKKDAEAARRLYKAAAEQGNAKAMHNLAVLYAEGAAVKPDYRTAAQWFRLAADHGVSDSQYNLAILYARGIGVDRNLAESYKWFALAAAQSDQEAARKRDDVGKHLDMQALAAARQAARDFVPQPQPEAAITAKPPPGGWDAPPASAADPAPAAKPKPRATAPVRLGSR